MSKPCPTCNSVMRPVGAGSCPTCGQDSDAIRSIFAAPARLDSVEARYKDLLDQLGVQGHDGATAEIAALRSSALSASAASIPTNDDLVAIYERGFKGAPIEFQFNMPNGEGVAHRRALREVYDFARSSSAESEAERLKVALIDLLGFARRRLATGFLPPQGARAIHLLAELGVPEYVEVYERHRGEVDTAAAQGAPRSASTTTEGKP